MNDFLIIAGILIAIFSWDLLVVMIIVFLYSEEKNVNNK